MTDELDIAHIEKRLGERYENIVPKFTRLQIMRQDIRQLLAEVERLKSAAGLPPPVGRQ